MFTLAFKLADQKIHKTPSFPTRGDAMDSAYRQFRKRSAEGWTFIEITDGNDMTVADFEDFEKYRKSKHIVHVKQ